MLTNNNDKHEKQSDIVELFQVETDKTMLNDTTSQPTNRT